MTILDNLPKVLEGFIIHHQPHFTEREELTEVRFLARDYRFNQKESWCQNLAHPFFPHLTFLFIRIKMIYVGHWIQGRELQFTHVRWLSLP